MYTKTAKGIALYSVLIIFAMFIASSTTSAQSSKVGADGMLLDESLIALKNKKLVFSGLSDMEINRGFTILSIVQDPEKGAVALLGNMKISYDPAANVCDAKDHFSYVISDGAYQTVKEMSVEILCEPIAILSSMSPDGDGKQDSFVIMGIENYPENELVIFNDLGLEIFRKNNYMNDWDGKYQGKNLPLGVYYYVFRTDDGEVVSGYLHMRDAI